ncbi:hypothetical protein ACE6H2_003580 [Prunus campanulata]
MGEVKAGDVHACPQQLLRHRHRPGGWAQRANDLHLGDTPIVGKLLHYSFDVYVRHLFKLDWIGFETLSFSTLSSSPSPTPSN